MKKLADDNDRQLVLHLTFKDFESIFEQPEEICKDYCELLSYPRKYIFGDIKTATLTEFPFSMVSYIGQLNEDKEKRLEVKKMLFKDDDDHT
jgi:hypothetical protein